MLVGQFQTFCNQLKSNESRSLTRPVQIPQLTQEFNFLPSSYDSNHSTVSWSKSSSSSSLEPVNYSNNNTNERKLPVRSEAIDKTILQQELRYNQLRRGNRPVYCSFCKNNNESEEIYKSHLLKNASGKITCPILKLHECPICHASGEQAHTITYCKKFKQLQRIEKINAVIKRF
jgi:hypothetical protein